MITISWNDMNLHKLKKITLLASTLLCMTNLYATTCSSTGKYSDWMSQLYQSNADVRLRDIAIPGTHDAGTFSIDSIGLIKDVAMTQSRDLCQQAQDGIRYFDLRVRNMDDDNKFIIVHSFVKGDELSAVLNPLYEFAVTHPKEVLILDFQELNDFEDSGDVERFNDYFLSKFSSLLIPRQADNRSVNAANIRIADSWNSHRNIIVLAKNEQVLASSDYFWHRGNNIDSPWANAATVADLKVHQDTQIRKYQGSDKFYVSQMQLTFLGSGDLFSKFTSLDNLADKANVKLYPWMMEYEIQLGLSPNIIMVDYYERQSKVVETSLAINRLRHAS